MAERRRACRRRPGEHVIVHADAGLAAVQALIRWDPAGYAERELAERSELSFPPAVRMAAVSGPAAAVEELLGVAGFRRPRRFWGPFPTIMRPRGRPVRPATRRRRAPPARRRRRRPPGTRADPGTEGGRIGPRAGPAGRAGDPQPAQGRRAARVQLDPAELI